MIKPIDPIERRKFDGFEMPPGSQLPNHLRLEEPDDRLGERVDAPMCQESRSGGGVRRGADMMIMEERVVDLSCDKALQAADNVLLAQTLSRAAGDVGHRRFMPAHADGGDAKECCVRLPVPSTKKSVAIGYAT